MGFLSKKEVEEYLKFSSNNSPSCRFSEDGFTVITLSDKIKFILQQAVTEELPGMRINLLADRFDRHNKSNDPGRLWAPMHSKGNARTHSASTFTASKLRSTITEILQPFIEKNILPNHFFAELARANYLLAKLHPTVDGVAKTKRIASSLELSNVNLLLKSKTLVHRQSLHIDNLTSGVVAIIPLLEATDNYNFFAIAGSQNAVFEVNGGQKICDNISTSTRIKRRKKVVCRDIHNPNHDVFGDLIIPGEAKVEEIILGRNEVIVFNEALIHAGGMAGKMMADRPITELYQDLNKKMKLKDPEQEAAELAIQVSFSLFGGAYGGGLDPGNAHPLWIKDERKISIANDHQSSVEVQRVNLSSIIKENNGIYGRILSESYKLWSLMIIGDNNN